MKRSSALLVLFLCNVVSAQTATVSVYAPPMLVLKHRLGLWQAQREDCGVTVTYHDVAGWGIRARFHQGVARVGIPVNGPNGNAIIPATWVRGVAHKAVDPCVCAGTLDNGDVVTINLPSEPVMFSRLERQRLRIRVVMVALPIDCPTTLQRKVPKLFPAKLDDFHYKTYTGVVHFNACEAHAVGRGARLADETTTPDATLTLQK